MSLAAYAAIVVGGIALASFPRPRKLYFRFLMGLVSAPLSYFAVMAIVPYFWGC
jgi:hypothetical protein